MSESTTASEAIAELLRLAVAEAKMHGEDVAPFLIAAVRSLSPEQLAELIGGSVESRPPLKPPLELVKAYGDWLTAHGIDADMVQGEPQIRWGYANTWPGHAFVEVWDPDRSETVERRVPLSVQEAQAFREISGRHASGRVVGPWLPVIPVTHQGEETT